MMFLLDISMKATIILAGAGVVSLLLRRYSAAARHLLWTGVMVALLLLPLASLVLPAWGVLPYWVGPERLAVGADVSELPVVTAVAELQVEQSATPQSVFESGLQERGATTALPQGASGVRLSASEWIAWVYLFGVFVVVVPLVFAPVYLRRLVRAAGRLEWRLLGEVCRELGVRRSVRLLRGGGRMPLTFGVWRPVILLPGGAEGWGEGRRRTVLLHELAHVKRWDTLVQLVARIACGVYWFHPLAWYAASRLSVERERACDDLVLRSGAEPSVYASELLSIAESHQSVRGGLAMAKASTLEGRLKAVLDPSRNRRGITRTAFLTCTVTLCVFAMVLATCHVAEKPSPTLTPPPHPPLTPEAWLKANGENIKDIHTSIDKEGGTLMHLAAKEGRVDVLVMLKERGADVVNARDNRNSTPMHWAARGGHIEAIKWLEEQGADINAKSKGGVTLMQWAASGGQVEAMKWLKERGADITGKDELDRLMCQAATSNSIEAMEWLKEQGADVNAKNYFTPMLMAVTRGNLEAMKWLKEQGADLNVRSPVAGLTLMQSAAWRGQVEAMKWLKEQEGWGADVNAKDELDSTHMHWAARGGQVEAMKWLKEQGADVNAKGRFGETPMHLAAEYGHIKVMKWLKDQGVDVNAEDHAILWEVTWKAAWETAIQEVREGNPEAKQRVIELVETRKNAPRHVPLMHSAARGGYVEAMKWLKDQGADVNVKNRFGETPLSAAKTNEAKEWLRANGAE